MYTNETSIKSDLLPDDSALQVNKRNIPSAKSFIWF